MKLILYIYFRLGSQGSYTITWAQQLRIHRFSTIPFGSVYKKKSTLSAVYNSRKKTRPQHDVDMPYNRRDVLDSASVTISQQRRRPWVSREARIRHHACAGPNGRLRQNGPSPATSGSDGPPHQPIDHGPCVPWQLRKLRLELLERCDQGLRNLLVRLLLIPWMEAKTA